MVAPHDAQSEKKTKWRTFFQHLNDDHKFEWPPEFDLDFENPVAVNKELIG